MKEQSQDKQSRMVTTNRLSQIVPILSLDQQQIDQQLGDNKQLFTQSNVPTTNMQQSDYFRSEYQSQPGNIRKNSIVFDNLTKEKYHLSPYRFIQLFLYIISDLSNSLSIYTFQTIAAQVSKIYDLDPFLVSLNLSFYSLLYPFVSILGNYIIDQRGAAFSVRIGVILTTIGFSLRLLINQNWGYVLLSSIFCGAGGPLIFNAKCRFQSNWFNAGDLPQITTISTIITSCNGIIGVLLPGFYFTGYDYSTDTSKDYEDGKTLMMNLLIIELVIVGICTGLSLLFLRDKPKKPPSFVSTIKRENFKEAIKGMIKNTAYLKLNVASMLLVGNTSALAALFSFAIQPWGFNQTDTTYCAAGMVVTGIIGSAINAPLLRKYKQFKKTTIILAGIMLINVAIIMGILNLESRIILVVFVSLFGGGYQPLVSTTYEYACEIVFPIGEGSAQGFLLGTSAIFGFICITSFGAIVRGENKSQTYIMLSYMIVCLIIGMLLIQTSKFRLNRFNTEIKNLKSINHQKIIFQNQNIFESPQKIGSLDKYDQKSDSDNQNQNTRPQIDQNIVMTQQDQIFTTNSNIPVLQSSQESETVQLQEQSN